HVDSIRMPAPLMRCVCAKPARTLSTFSATSTLNRGIPPGCQSHRRTDYRRVSECYWRVSEWLAATLEMWCPARGCGFESRALRLSQVLDAATHYAGSRRRFLLRCRRP